MHFIWVFTVSQTIPSGVSSIQMFKMYRKIFLDQVEQILMSILSLLYILFVGLKSLKQGHVAQSVICLAADMCLTVDPRVESSIPARPHTFAEIDHEIIYMIILFHSADSRRVVVSYKRKNVHEVLVN